MGWMGALPAGKPNGPFQYFIFGGFGYEPNVSLTGPHNLNDFWELYY